MQELVGEEQAKQIEALETDQEGKGHVVLKPQADKVWITYTSGRDICGKLASFI